MSFLDNIASGSYRDNEGGYHSNFSATEAKDLANDVLNNPSRYSGLDRDSYNAIMERASYLTGDSTYSRRKR